MQMDHIIVCRSVSEYQDSVERFEGQEGGFASVIRYTFLELRGAKRFIPSSSILVAGARGREVSTSTIT